jgi:iron uptake system EfeUOB component EfeO/EfeM
MLITKVEKRRKKTGGRLAGTPNKSTEALLKYQAMVDSQHKALLSQRERIVGQVDSIAILRAEIVDLRNYVERAEAALQLFNDMPWYRKAFFIIR